MKKTLISIAMACLLALLPTLCLAELDMDVVYQYMPSIKPIQGTGYLTMESKKDNSLGLFTSAGEEVIPFGCAAINYLNHGFFSVSKLKDAQNALAIFQGGLQISDYQYGVVTVYDRHWVAGTVLQESAEEADVTLNNVKYQISRWDLYYVGEGPSEEGFLAGSLDRQQFAEAKQHGNYMSIKDREGNVKVYDQSFQQIPMEAADVKASYYQVETYQIISKITNEVIANGYSEVAEADLPGRMLLIASAVNMSGLKVSAILDLDGAELMPAEYSVVTMGDPYVVVANEAGLRGLYSLEDKKLIVPCEFSNIVACATSVDTYVNNGYVCVEKDGKRGFVSVETGETTLEPAFNGRIAKNYGCALVFDGEDGYVLVSADGMRSDMPEYDEISATRGDGTLLVAKKGGFFGVIDWHGEEVLPFIHKNAITFTDDSKAMIRTSTGLELDVINAH